MLQELTGPAPAQPVVVLTTAPDATRAAAIAHALVDEGLVACVNIVPAVRSIYRWQGRICDDAEVLCVIKTTRAALAALEARLGALHPYEIPEFVVLDVASGSAPYLTWLVGSVSAPA